MGRPHRGRGTEGTERGTESIKRGIDASLSAFSASLSAFSALDDHYNNITGPLLQLHCAALEEVR